MEEWCSPMRLFTGTILNPANDGAYFSVSLLPEKFRLQSMNTHRHIAENSMAIVSTTLDHLAFVAANLEQGAARCEELLGIRPQPGGEHGKMGTHNMLLRLGEGVYLEVISINPLAGDIGRPRWFGMDLPEIRSRAAQVPFLATFVARTNDIDACWAAMPTLGRVTDMQRGALEWRITIPDDGSINDGGTVPTVIQWPDGVHPAGKLMDTGCSLKRLEISSPAPSSLEEKWQSIGLHTDERLTIRQAAETSLVAHIATPSGMRMLY